MIISPRQKTIAVAKRLLGSLLISETPEGRCIGRIVETEAYLKDDPACHASRGMTKRTQVMFGPPGHAYIYLIYGMYDCFNVVTAPEGVGEAVLIRALEPLEGQRLMLERRPTAKKPGDLCSGPGKLVLAMGIKRSQNGACLTDGVLRLQEGKPIPSKDIVVTQRIGITQGAEHPYRFYVKGSKWISKK